MNQLGIRQDVSYVLNATDVPAVYMEPIACDMWNLTISHSTFQTLTTHITHGNFPQILVPKAKDKEDE